MSELGSHIKLSKLKSVVNLLTIVFTCHFLTGQSNQHEKGTWIFNNYGLDHVYRLFNPYRKLKIFSATEASYYISRGSGESGYLYSGSYQLKKNILYLCASKKVTFDLNVGRIQEISDNINKEFKFQRTQHEDDDKVDFRLIIEQREFKSMEIDISFDCILKQVNQQPKRTDLSKWKGYNNIIKKYPPPPPAPPAKLKNQIKLESEIDSLKANRMEIVYETLDKLKFESLSHISTSIITIDHKGQVDSYNFLFPKNAIIISKDSKEYECVDHILTDENLHLGEMKNIPTSRKRVPRQKLTYTIPIEHKMRQ